MGVPVLLSRWPTFEYYFPDNTVNYFAPGSHEQLAAAALAIHRDSDGARARAKRAQALYQESYAWRIQREIYLGVYAHLLHDTSREPAHAVPVRRAS